MAAGQLPTDQSWQPPPAAEGVDMNYDLIVIGGGTAGLNAAKAARNLGASLAIVEEEGFAGTCLLRG
jgi:heterodisulfide reductase subunit A-like polyferredoxin